MENEANGLTDSFVARHTTDPTLRLELISRDEDSGMGAEVRTTEYSIAIRWGEGRQSPKLKLRSQLLLTTT